MRVIGCNAAYGAGGIGQHLAHLVEEFRDAGTLHQYLAPRVRPHDAHGHVVASPRLTSWVQACPPIRWMPGWRNHIGNDLYDRALADALPPTGHTYMGFVGKSLRTFHAAHRAGYTTLELVAANSHVDTVTRQHAKAARDLGIRDSWLNNAQRRKTKAEYALADRIYVHSTYVHNSFVEAGFPESRLVRTHLHPADRFVPPAHRSHQGPFHIVYVGRLDATKGIPLLIDTLSHMPYAPLRLTLVGGWSTPTMRRYMQRAGARDPRITVAPGDPLPVLQQADVFVHPSYEDGFGYAPAEALACGVPVVATRDTGMAEHITQGVNGYVVPTGSVEALVDRIRHLMDHPLATTTSLWPHSTAVR